MFRKAFLIGFQYEGKKKLPGIITDLYKVYCFLIKQGWEEKEIVILTDIVCDDSTDVLRRAILENTVNSDVLTFIEDCKERNQYILFKSHTHHNNFSNIFKCNDMSEICKNYFVYYTGHCKERNIILPNTSYLSLDVFREYLIAERTICIMDCCEGGIELPFLLNGSIYRCKDNLKKTDFIRNEMICISSSLGTEKSITSNCGSFFTRHIFSILEDDSLSLSFILEKLLKNSDQYNDVIQTATISSSHPHIYYIPGFFYSFPTFSLFAYKSHLVLEL